MRARPGRTLAAPAGAPAAPGRVLLIKPSALGDVVTALPVLRGLRRTFGKNLHVAWLVLPGYAPLIAEDADLDEVIPFERARLGRLWRSLPAAREFRALCRRLREARFDWVLDMQGLFRSGYLARASRAPVRAGFAAAREGARLFYTHALPRPDTPLHTVDRNIALARHLGIDARPEDYRLEVPPAGRAFAEAFRARHGAGYIVLAPATRWPTKLYPAPHWQFVIRQLARRRTVVLVAGAGERHLTAPLSGGENVVDLSGRTSVAELVGLIAASGGLLGCDSATMNIATAVGVPQVTLIGPTDPARTGPYGRPGAIVQSPLPCRACRRRRCPHGACMRLIRPADVLEAVERNFPAG